MAGVTVVDTREGRDNGPEIIPGQVTRVHGFRYDAHDGDIAMVVQKRIMPGDELSEFTWVLVFC
jgi:hypothetical protein